MNSFRHAWHGLVHTVLHQQNMRVHVVAAVWVGLVGSAIPLGLAEKVTLIFCVLLVFFAEILNSALEALVDLAVEQVHEKARITKDAAAAGVLVLAIGTVVIFAALTVHNFETIVSRTEAIVRQASWGVPFTACLALLIRRRATPVWLDALLGVSGLMLWLGMATFTESYVFSGMLFGLWAMAASASRQKRRELAQKVDTKKPA